MKVAHSCCAPLIVAAVAVCCFAQDSATKAKDYAADLAALKKLTTAFVNAYNGHDAKQLATYFSPDGELGERSGSKKVGREEIQLAFAGKFKASPKSQVSIGVDSIHFVTDNVAIAEGAATSYPDGETASAQINYRIGFAKRKGQWLIVGMRAFDTRILSNYEYLRQLEWMVGDWVDEDNGAVVRASVRWSPNRAFLERRFMVTTKDDRVLRGTQRIGWDPQKKQIRSWLFDSEGGFLEGHWTPVNAGWIVRNSGYLVDGTSVSGTVRMDRETNDRYVMSMFNRLRGSEAMPDIDVTVVRKPPAPQEQKKSP